MPDNHTAHDHTLRAVQVNQPDPATLQYTTNQPPDLRALLQAIPSPVHVENLALSVQQNTVNNGTDAESMRAYME